MKKHCDISAKGPFQAMKNKMSWRFSAQLVVLESEQSYIAKMSLGDLLHVAFHLFIPVENILGVPC